MGLSDDEVIRLLTRCARQRRVLLAVRLVRSAFELCWPGVLAVLVALAAARALKVQLSWVPFAIGVWFAYCAYRLARVSRSLAPPRWFWVAYADRHGRAGGSLLKRFETGSGDSIPRSVLDVPLTAELPWREIAGAIGIAAAYAACLTWPLPAAAPAQAPPLVPLPVERVQQLVEQVVPRDPETQALVARATQSLRALEAKQGGLRRPDFAALERIEKQARGVLERDVRRLSDAREALQTMQTLLASAPAPNAGADERAAGALRDAAQRMEGALSRADIDPGRFQELLNQAQRNAERRGGRASGEPRKHQPFDAADLRALQQEIGQLQRIIASQQKGSGGGERRPGVASIDFQHQPTWLDGARFESQTFQTQPDHDTVLLSGAFTKRDETPQADPLAQSARTFEPGSDTEFWDKHLSPRRRALLRRYFDERESHE